MSFDITALTFSPAEWRSQDFSEPLRLFKLLDFATPRHLFSCQPLLFRVWFEPGDDIPDDPAKVREYVAALIAERDDLKERLKETNNTSEILRVKIVQLKIVQLEAKIVQLEAEIHQQKVEIHQLFFSSLFSFFFSSLLLLLFFSSSLLLFLFSLLFLFLFLLLLLFFSSSLLS